MADELDYSVDLDDFTMDAKWWRSVGEVVHAACSTIQGVETIPGGMTDGISFAAGFVDQYNKAATDTLDFLLEGARTCDELATKLDDTRKQYADSDEYARWKFHNR